MEKAAMILRIGKNGFTLIEITIVIVILGIIIFVSAPEFINSDKNIEKTRKIDSFKTMYSYLFEKAVYVNKDIKVSFKETGISTNTEEELPEGLADSLESMSSSFEDNVLVFSKEGYVQDGFISLKYKEYTIRFEIKNNSIIEMTE